MLTGSKCILVKKNKTQQTISNSQVSTEQSVCTETYISPYSSKSHAVFKIIVQWALYLKALRRTFNLK